MPKTETAEHDCLKHLMYIWFVTTCNRILIVHRIDFGLTTDMNFSEKNCT